MRKFIKLITSIQTDREKNEEPDCQRNKRDAIMIESTGFKGIIKKLNKQHFANNSNNLSEMDKFLER